MRKYLSTLPKRSDRHKSNFALMVSGGITLTIFGFWLSAHYKEAPVVAKDTSTHELGTVRDIGPFESLSATVGDGWQQIQGKVSNLFDNLGTVNVKQGYQDMKNESITTYGR